MRAILGGLARLGRMRTDLLIVWPASAPPGGRQRKMVIECKVLRGRACNRNETAAKLS